MLLYDALSSPWLYDVLDETPGTIYTQHADGVIALSGGAAQEWPGAYEQPLDCTLQLHGGAVQVFLAPGGPQAYLQQANGVLLLVGGGLQEHAPVAAGEDGQSGNGVVTLTGGAYQQHIPGANTGELLQIGDGAIVLSGGALQSHVLPTFVRTATVAVDSVQPYGPDSVPPLVFNFGAPPPSVSRVAISFTSADELFTTGVGPNGGAVCVEVSLRDVGVRQPLVSLTIVTPTAEFFMGQSGSVLDVIANAVFDGRLDLELRAYEALPYRVAPLQLGASSLTVEVLP